MAQNKKDSGDENLELVEGALSKTERFIEQNQKVITYVILGIIVLVGAYLAFNRFYLARVEKDAHAEMYIAEQYFERDSFNLAVNGDGNYPGFLNIIEEYGITKSANLAHYYAGVCYLNMGKFDDAIEHLDKFDADDKQIAPLAIGVTGDAFLEKGDKQKAIDYYLKASKFENSFTSPIFLKKAGFTYELLGDYANALKMYEKIQTEYPKTTEGQMIEKYIVRAKLKL